MSEEYVEIDTNQIEPPVPAGLDKLSPAQKAFTEIFEIDEHLLTVACAASDKPKVIPDETLQQAISQLSDSERQDFLLRLVRGEPNLSIKLKQRLSELIIDSPSASHSRRTIKQIGSIGLRVISLTNQWLAANSLERRCSKFLNP